MLLFMGALYAFVGLVQGGGYLVYLFSCERMVSRHSLIFSWIFHDADNGQEFCALSNSDLTIFNTSYESAQQRDVLADV